MLQHVARRAINGCCGCAIDSALRSKMKNPIESSPHAMGRHYWNNHHLIRFSTCDNRAILSYYDMIILEISAFDDAIIWSHDHLRILQESWLKHYGHLIVWQGDDMIIRAYGNMNRWSDDCNKHLVMWWYDRMIMRWSDHMRILWSDATIIWQYKHCGDMRRWSCDAMSM